MKEKDCQCRWALLALLLGWAWFQVVVSPYTKVEESFNLQAVHDLLQYGWHVEKVTLQRR